MQFIVSQYFLHQRIKLTDPSDTEHYDKYIKQLTLLHKLSVYSMKAKQTTDLSNIDILAETVEEFENIYFHTHE